MSRSITLRFILAFLLVSITVVALASGITYWLTVREFTQLTFDQTRDRFVADMAFYYQTKGSWDGVLAYYQQRNEVRTPFSGGPGSPPGPGGQVAPQRPAFALADQNGRVLIPAGGYTVDSTVAQTLLAEGTAVTANDTRVGTVLAAGALSYLFKKISAEDLAAAVRAVAQGQTYISPSLNVDPALRKKERQ